MVHWDLESRGPGPLRPRRPGYIADQAARAGSQLVTVTVPAGTYRDRLAPARARARAGTSYAGRYNSARRAGLHNHHSTL